MLPRALRMRSARDFQSTARFGRRFRQPLCVVLLHVDPGASGHMLGITAGKSVGNSVERHRVTRRIRAVLGAEGPRFPQGTRIVVKALSGSPSSPETVPQLRRALQQAYESLG